MDERLDVATLITEHPSDAGRGAKPEFGVTNLLGQSIHNPLAGYEDLKEAERIGS